MPKTVFMPECFVSVLTHYHKPDRICMCECMYVCMCIMCVCMYVCVCMYYVCIHVCMCVFMYIYVCVYVCMCVYILCVYVYVSISMCVYVFVYILCMYVCICVYICICMCVCMYVRTYVYMYRLIRVCSSVSYYYDSVLCVIISQQRRWKNKNLVCCPGSCTTRHFSACFDII
jgi:hypothetical protein